MVSMKGSRFCCNKQIFFFQFTRFKTVLGFFFGLSNALFLFTWLNRHRWLFKPCVYCLYMLNVFLCSTWCRFRNVLFWYMYDWISRLIFRRFFHSSISSMAICLLDQERVKCLCLCCVSMWYKNMHIIQMQQLDTRRIRAYLGVCRKKVCCMLVCVCIWSRKMRK